MTTGEAARLCAVTPNAVLKWIQAGLLPARRTLGGHHRIHRRDLEPFLASSRPPSAAPAPSAVDQPAVARGEDSRLRYCWEFKGKGRLLDGCRECVVFEMRAQRCYEVVKLAPGHSRLFCKTSCDACDYYQRVHAQRTNVLLVTDDEEVAVSLRHAAELVPFNLQTTSCEYACSMLVEQFRPDFAVVDCALGPDAARDFCKHLSEDPRIPFVRVILAGGEGEFPDACESAVFARLQKPFGVDDVLACTTSVPSGTMPELDSARSGDSGPGNGGSGPP